MSIVSSIRARLRLPSKSVLIVGMVVALVAAAVVRTALARPPLRNDEPTHPLSEGWTHRWGPSPLAAGGVPEWAVSDAEPAAWTPTVIGAYPVPDRPDRHEMWQRIRLPEAPGDHDASLFVPAAWKVFDVYLDGRRVYGYGTVEPDGTLVYPGKSWHFIPLGRDYGGKYLAFHCRSDDRYFGVYRVPYIGAERDHMLSMLQIDGPWLALGGVYVALALLTIGTLARFRRDMTYVAFATYVLAVGVYDIVRTNAKQLVLNWPIFWDSVELLTAYFIPIPILFFFEIVFGAGPHQLFRRLRQFQSALVLLSLVYVVVFAQAPWPMLMPFQVFFVVAASGMIASAGKRAISTKSFDAVVFALGYTAAAGSGIHDVLAAVGIIEGQGYLSHLGVGGLIIALATLSARRFVSAYEAQKGLELARDIQGLLLPKEMQGAFAGVDFQGYCLPHSQVSGDWVQFWTMGDAETRLLFGDVTGKGPQAAIAMAAVSAVVDRCRRQGVGLASCITDVSEGLRELFSGEVGTTVSAVSLKPGGEAEVYNAGGLGWFHLSKAGVRHLRLPADTLGYAPDVVPARATLQLEPGDFLFSFTDGVLEGTRGVHELKKLLAKTDTDALDAASLRDLVIAAGKGHALDDDKTMLVLHWPSLAASERRSLLIEAV